jgi:hypothetical protein
VSTGAFLLLPLIDRARKLSVLLAFLGGTLTAVVVLLSHNLELLLAFYTILLINMVFSEWA